MIKIVWLCHFANEEMKAFFNTPHIKEFAPWIDGLIKLFRERTDVEIHIVAPNVFTNKHTEMLLNNIHYHFYKHRPNFILNKIVYRMLKLELRTNYFLVKQNIFKIIERINPDIIHLHGAENPYYSAGILPLIKHYPHLVTIQGFIRNSTERNSLINKKIQIEEKILKTVVNIGVRTKEMSEIVLNLNPRAKLHYHNYTWTTSEHIKDSSRASTFDIIFFARVTKDKGIEDLLEAISIVKKEKPDVSLHVIGRAEESYLQKLKNLTNQLNIRDNVKFLGFMETQQDIYKYAINAKICVLPTYHDVIPGTIVESMLIKLPCISYNVGGLPELNEKIQTVILVERCNINQLANEITSLLNDKNKRELLAEHAFTYIHKKFNNSDAVSDILRAYSEILSS
jgi:glycosyltransferase involved in cell wall biosynthesis